MTIDVIGDRRQAYLVGHVVSYVLGVKGIEIMASGRGSRLASKGRQLSMYLAHVSLGWSIGRVADAFRRDRSTVSHACQLIEYERDDEAVDHWICEMEESLLKLVPLAGLAA
ncbi:MAG: helix-turn-helix domain-containing protein [Pseudomonadota bacterium]